MYLLLAYHRRRIVHFNVTANPTAEWTAQRIVEAFPEESAPRYLLRDRDGTYGPPRTGVHWCPTSDSSARERFGPRSLRSAVASI